MNLKTPLSQWTAQSSPVASLLGKNRFMLIPAPRWSLKHPSTAGVFARRWSPLPADFSMASPLIPAWLPTEICPESPLDYLFHRVTETGGLKARSNFAEWHSCLSEFCKCLIVFENDGHLCGMGKTLVLAAKRQTRNSNKTTAEITSKYRFDY